MEQQIESQYDVCICGGGIAGLVTAFALGQNGRRVLIVEKNATFNPNGADVLKPSCIKVLEQLGLYNLLLDNGAIKRDKVLIYHGGTLVSEMDYTQEHERKYFMLIPYKKVLDILLAKIKEIKNINFLFNTALTSASLDASGNITEVLLNEHITVNASVYIAADGIMSKLRSILAVPTVIERYAQQMYFAQFPMAESVASFNRLYVDKNYALAYFYPVGTDHFRCVIGFEKEEGDYYFLQKKNVELLKNRLARFVTESDDAIETIDSLDQFVTFPLCRINLDAYYKNNVVFIGNAAHSIHPITGQGMNLAIEDAGVLYPLLEQVFNGSNSLSESFFIYQNTRHQVNKKLIEYGHNLISSLDDCTNFTNSLNLKLQTSNRVFQESLTGV